MDDIHTHKYIFPCVIPTETLQCSSYIPVFMMKLLKFEDVKLPRAIQPSINGVLTMDLSGSTVYELQLDFIYSCSSLPSDSNSGAGGKFQCLTMRNV